MSRNFEIGKLLAEAWNQRRVENYAEARQLLNDAHQRCDENDYENLGRIHHIYMQLASDHSLLEQASAHSLKSIEFYLQANDQLKWVHASRHYADLLSRMGKLDEAEKQYQSVLNTYKTLKLDDSLDYANTVRGLAVLLEQKEKYVKARNLWEETKRIYSLHNVQAGVEEANDRLDQLSKNSFK